MYFAGTENKSPGLEDDTRIQSCKILIMKVICGSERAGQKNIEKKLKLSMKNKLNIL